MIKSERIRRGNVRHEEKSPFRITGLFTRAYEKRQTNCKNAISFSNLVPEITILGTGNGRSKQYTSPICIMIKMQSPGSRLCELRIVEVFALLVKIKSEKSLGCLLNSTFLQQYFSKTGRVICLFVTISIFTAHTKASQIAKKNVYSVAKSRNTDE